MRITVAWQLCWYQWGVDLGDELRPVFEIARGEEVEQLDRSARQWNATLGRTARLALGRPDRGGRAARRLAEAPLKLVVNVDGGARGNPGPAAIAAVVTTPDGEVLESRRVDRPGDQQRRRVQSAAAGDRAGRVARRARGRPGRRLELIVKQVKGEYQVKDPGLRPLHAEVRQALEGFERWSIRHVRREHNAEADRLVNETLDEAAG